MGFLFVWREPTTIQVMLHVLLVLLQSRLHKGLVGRDHPSMQGGIIFISVNIAAGDGFSSTRFVPRVLGRVSLLASGSMQFSCCDFSEILGAGC